MVKKYFGYAPSGSMKTLTKTKAAKLEENWAAAKHTGDFSMMSVEMLSSEKP